jgi:hypothetical protein
MLSRALLLSFSLLLFSGSALAQDGGGDPSADEAAPPADSVPREAEPREAEPTTPTPVADPAPAPVIHEPVATTAPVAQTSPPPPAREEEDDGRDSDFLWLEVGFGYSWADLAAFSNDNFIPGVEQFKGSGYAGHAAAGFKLFLLTLGARGTVASYPTAERPFDLWSIMFDLMLRIPILFAEPYFRAGVGYAWMGSLDFASLGESAVRVFGLTIEAGAGIDFYLNPYVSIGAGVDVAFLNLTRQRVDQCMGVGGAMCDVGSVDFSEDGDAVGLQLRASGHIALHF